jgi:hypothetical protein
VARVGASGDRVARDGAESSGRFRFVPHALHLNRFGAIASPMVSPAVNFAFAVRLCLKLFRAPHTGHRTSPVARSTIAVCT